MQRLMREAASSEAVDVIGSAPYVEALSKADQEQLSDRDRKSSRRSSRSAILTLSLTSPSSMASTSISTSTTISTRLPAGWRTVHDPLRRHPVSKTSLVPHLR